MSVCCVLSGRGLCDGSIASSRGVLPTVVRRCVWSGHHVNEEALPTGGWHTKHRVLIMTYKHNVSVNNTTLYFIYNKNNILSRRNVSTFIRSSSGPLGKQTRELSIFQCIWDPTMHRNIDSSRMCFARGSEDELIKFETCRPDNILFLLYIKWSVVLLTDTLCLYVITLWDGKH